MNIPADMEKRILSFLDRAGFTVQGSAVDVALLAQGGSDRMFYRVKLRDRAGVVMHDPREKHEIEEYTAVGTFLFKQRIGVPEIIACDRENSLVLMEDLGDVSLYSLLNQGCSRAAVMDYYRSALQFLAEMHIKATPLMHACSAVKAFGYEDLLWETGYFLERFVEQLCGLSIHGMGEIEDEFHRLAALVERQPRVFMHRDFQSQNIYFKDGRVRVIDFQTARAGPLQYDLASLLKDAYFVLEKDERKALAHFYHETLRGARGMDMDPEACEAAFHLTGLQRNMQALGAFAFLSLEKGKTVFLQYIPAALSYLQEALALFPEFPVLRATVQEAREAVKNRY